MLCAGGLDGAGGNMSMLAATFHFGKGARRRDLTARAFANFR